MNLSSLSGKRTLPFLVFVLGVTFAIQADEVVLGNGKTLRGDVENASVDRVVVRTNDGLVTLPRSDVRSIKKEDPQETQLKMAELAAKRGDWSGALAPVQKDNSPSSSVLYRSRGFLLENGDSLLRQSRNMTPAELGAAAQALSGDQLGKTMLVRLFASRSDWRSAQVHLAGISAEWLNQHPGTKALVLQDLTPATLLGNRELAECASSIAEWIASVAPESVTSATIVHLQIASARHYASADQFGAAVEVLRTRIIPASPQLAFRTYIDLAKQSRSTSSPVAILAFFADLERLEEFEGQEEVFTRHAHLLVDAQDYDSAERVAVEFGKSRPDEAARLGHWVEFQRRLSAVSEESAEERYKLAAWARERGLDEEALSLLQDLQRHPEIGENAKLQMELIRVQQEKKEIAHLEEMLEKRAYDEVAAKAVELKRRNPSGNLSRKAGELEQLAKYHKWRISQGHGTEADVLYQNLERLYLQGRLDEASGLADKLAVEHAGSAAAKQSEKIRDSIARQKQIRGAQQRAPAPR